MQMRQRPVDPAATDIAAARVWQFDCVDGDGNVLWEPDRAAAIDGAVDPEVSRAVTEALRARVVTAEDLLRAGMLAAGQVAP